MEKPLITVFTPTYNRAHTLDRVFESLKNQTFKDFEWIIINDGSTDNTEDVVNGFKQDSDLRIRYFKQENQHKFLTFFKAVELAQGQFFVGADSDDEFDFQAFEKLLLYWRNMPSNAIFLSVLSKDKNGEIIGDPFPENGFLTTIFDMRYRYKIKGDKWGMTKTAVYRKLSVELEKLKGHGFIPEGVYQYYFDRIGLHYGVNEALRIYIRDSEDQESLANTYYSDQNAFGLAENYKTFLNVYAAKKWKYPKTLFRNLLGYLIYSAKDKRPYYRTISEVEDFSFKIITVLIYPFKPILKRKKIA